MKKLLSILLLVTNICLSQLDTTFSKYDSILMWEINLLRKSYGLNELDPSLKLRKNVTNVHAQYLKNVKIVDPKNWGHHPEIISSNENLIWSSFEIKNNSSYKSEEYQSLSILYVIDMFYHSGMIKKSDEFFDSFYYWITKPDTIYTIRDRKIDKERFESFKSFVYTKHKDFWLSDFEFEFTINGLISTYGDFIKQRDETKKDDGIYYINKSQNGKKISYLINGTHMRVTTYLGMKNLFVDKMGLDINYLFNKENLDYFRWETKESLYEWYVSEGHKQNLLIKGYKNISVIRTTNYLGYLIILMNIQNEDDELIILKKEEYDKIVYNKEPDEIIERNYIMRVFIRIRNKVKLLPK